MYRNAASLAVATLRFFFVVARFSAERILSLLAFNSLRGIFIAIPGFSDSRSSRMVPIMPWCLPLRLCGTSTIEVVGYLEVLGGVFAMASSIKIVWNGRERVQSTTLDFLDAIIKV